MNKIIEHLYQSIGNGIYRARPAEKWTCAIYRVDMITQMSRATCDFKMKDGQSKSVDAGSGVLDDFIELRAEMAKFDPENVAWYSATCRLTPDLNFKFEVEYDRLPNIGVVPDPDMWIDEFKQYPRPEMQALIQDWIDQKVEHDVVRRRIQAMQAP